jgi:Cft2 family RNA processing exonuclease
VARQGFTGPVLTTAHSAALAEIVLRDSARLLAEDAEQANSAGWSKHRPALPLYTEDDVDMAVQLISPVDLGQSAAAGPAAEVTLHRAGHILGSAWAELKIAGNHGTLTVATSEDLGRPGHPLLRPPEPLTGSDVPLVEGTYGNRRHSADSARAQFAAAISRTLRHGGSMIIPAFAVDRTEVILRTIRQLRAGPPATPSSLMSRRWRAEARQALREPSSDAWHTITRDPLTPRHASAWKPWKNSLSPQVGPPGREQQEAAECPVERRSFPPCFQAG